MNQRLTFLQVVAHNAGNKSIDFHGKADGLRHMENLAELLRNTIGLANEVYVRISIANGPSTLLARFSTSDSSSSSPSSSSPLTRIWVMDLYCLGQGLTLSLVINDPSFHPFWRLYALRHKWSVTKMMAATPHYSVETSESMLRFLGHNGGGTAIFAQHETQPHLLILVPLQEIVAKRYDFL